MVEISLLSGGRCSYDSNSKDTGRKVAPAVAKRRNSVEQQHVLEAPGESSSSTSDSSCLKVLDFQSQ